MKQELRLVAFLSMRDLLHESRLTICSIAALAAVLTPLILLFGLKTGLIEGLRTDLVENPRTRTITNTSNRSFDDPFLAQLGQRPDVVFVAPRLRTLNSEARFERRDRPGRVARAELLSSGPGDPLLGTAPVPADLEVVATASLAARLELSPGMSLAMRVFRSRDSEILALTVTLKGVAPQSSLGRDAVFVTKPLMLLVDDFLDGKLPATATTADVALSGRSYSGFRVHARRLEDVIRIDNDLRRADVGVETHATEISGLLGLERSLDLLFALLASLGAAGFLVSLGIGLYANVERKQRELSLLRLLGLLRRSLMLLPVMQAAAVSFVGAVAAALLALGAAALLNLYPLVGDGASVRPLCVIQFWHLVAAVAASLVGAVLAAGFAGRRAANILPVEGLADG